MPRRSWGRFGRGAVFLAWRGKLTKEFTRLHGFVVARHSEWSALGGRLTTNKAPIPTFRLIKKTRLAFSDMDPSHGLAQARGLVSPQLFVCS